MTLSHLPHSLRIIFLGLGIALLAAASTGCRPRKKPAPPMAIDYTRELPPGQMALRKISPGEYPDFTVTQSNWGDVIKSIDNSLAYLDAPSSRQHFPYLDISHERAVASLRALRETAMALAPSTKATGPRDFNETIRRDFEVYKSIGAPSPDGAGYTGSVLFTGYFTPIYEASLTRQGLYQYPLHKRPADLITDPVTGEGGARKLPDGGQIPYYTRRQIESPNGPLAGQELVWLKDRWDAYVITVQGSARLRLADQNGKIHEVGYAGQNGYPYTSPGKQMVADGVIPREKLTLRGLRDHFRSDPAAMDKYLALNERYVFFAERPGGPFGSLNVPVTTMATIATDKQVYPRAMPAFLIVPVPSNETGATAPFRGFMMDQDTGGAIRAAGRTDIYMGVGEAAERVAGQQLHPGELYYIALKPERVARYLTKTARMD